ncbi:MAG: transposase family protein [Chloroflexi bacterium]|nr:transposase family protein [Chloroflexota bacterium]
MSLSMLFPQFAGLRLEQVALDGEAVTLHLASSARFACCPLCTRRSKRVQSIYHRTVADLPLAGRQPLLRLRVRRFRCGVPGCPRAIFAERFPKLAAAYGRRTLGQRAALEAIAFALGGSAGARLATRLSSPISRATLLRLLRSADVARTACSSCAWGRRLGLPQGSSLRHHPGRSGAATDRRSPRGSKSRDAGAVAQPVSRN